MLANSGQSGIGWRVDEYVIDYWWVKMGTIGDGREGLVAVGYGLVHLFFMGMTVDLVIPACDGIGRVGEGGFVQGRVDAVERGMRGERTAVGDGMRV